MAQKIAFLTLQWIILKINRMEMSYRYNYSSYKNGTLCKNELKFRCAIEFGRWRH